jgi:DNA-directed RNA polymerase specialized sigma24 family protein
VSRWFLRRRRPLSPAVLSDRALLDAVGAGSRTALFELFNRHGGAVHHLAGLVAADEEAADRVVEEVFVAVGRAGGMEDNITDVRLGLLAMAWRRSPAGAAPDDARDALALAVLAGASLTDVARVLQVDRQVAASHLRSGLVAAGQRRERADR